jgi:hypothetical protein
MFCSFGKVSHIWDSRPGVMETDITPYRGIVVDEIMKICVCLEKKEDKFNDNILTASTC